MYSVETLARVDTLFDITQGKWPSRHSISVWTLLFLKKLMKLFSLYMQNNPTAQVIRSIWRVRTRLYSRITIIPFRDRVEGWISNQLGNCLFRGPRNAPQEILQRLKPGPRITGLDLSSQWEFRYAWRILPRMVAIAVIGNLDPTVKGLPKILGLSSLPGWDSKSSLVITSYCFTLLRDMVYES